MSKLIYDVYVDVRMCRILNMDTTTASEKKRTLTVRKSPPHLIYCLSYNPITRGLLHVLLSLVTTATAFLVAVLSAIWPTATFSNRQLNDRGSPTLLRLS